MGSGQYSVGSSEIIERRTMNEVCAEIRGAEGNLWTLRSPWYGGPLFLAPDLIILPQIIVDEFPRSSYLHPLNPVLSHQWKGNHFISI
jgi:hypothetical protein